MEGTWQEQDGTDGQMDDYKVSHRTLEPKLKQQSVSTTKPPFRTRTDISAQLLKSRGISYRLRGLEHKKSNFKKQKHAWIRSRCNIFVVSFSIHFRTCIYFPNIFIYDIYIVY